jgi:hypothetical protein
LREEHIVWSKLLVAHWGNIWESFGHIWGRLHVMLRLVIVHG